MPQDSPRPDPATESMREAGRRFGHLPAHRILLGLVGLGVVVVIAGAAALWFGLVTVSARPPHMAPVAATLHHTFKASVARRAEAVVAPASLSDPGMIELGAQHFAGTCASCHGGPGLGQSPLALSMRPRPQHLPDVVGQFSDKELFVILRDGVRFSAMPAWPADANYDEIWSVVAFLRKLPDLDPTTYANMTAGVPSKAPDQTPWRHAGKAVTLDVGAKAPPMDEYAYSAPGTGWRPIGLHGDPLSSCEGCHGSDGTGDKAGGWAANLTLADADYLKGALLAYASGSRASGIMATVATALSRPQMEALAQHFASLPEKVAKTGHDVPADAVKRGEQIALHGITEAAVPACTNCHGDTAREKAGIAEIPPLAGQNAPYLRHRLEAYANEPYAVAAGTAGFAWHPMNALASRLTPADRDAVAAYFASLEPGKTPAPAAGASPEGGAQIVTQVCSKCHQKNLAGVESGEYPNLTLQSAPYIRQQLAAFRNELRHNSKMFETANDLSPAQIETMAAYIGSQPALPSVPPKDRAKPTDAQMQMAKRLATQGDPSRGIPACASCHGPKPTEALGVIPRIDGQNANFIETRLKEWRDRDPGSTYSPMPAIARAITPEERTALADFFASHPPQSKK